jgi:cystathionine beta-lyase/cystathionine gamma-synthase
MPTKTKSSSADNAEGKRRNTGEGGNTQGFDTRQIHCAIEPRQDRFGSITAPLYLATTFVQDSVDEYCAKGFSYSRCGNPTVRMFENKVNELEGGNGCTAWNSGMAAINALFLAFLKSGDHCIISSVCYGGTYRLSTKIYSNFGIEFEFVDSADIEAVRAAIRPNTTMILTETPANPTMKLTDIQAVSDITRERGIIHACDGTFIPPCNQLPLALGADIVVHSTTKYFDGHSQTVGGAVICASEEHHQKMIFVQKSSGTIMTPFVAWVTLQSVKTMSLRFARQSENAMRVAQFLESHPKVLEVRYPGLESHPQHELACRQATSFGAMMWFKVQGGINEAKAFMDYGFQTWTLAENLGSMESLVTWPVGMTHADVEKAERDRVGITDNLIRLSCGSENIEDLLADLTNALESINTPQ